MGPICSSLGSLSLINLSMYMALLLVKLLSNLLLVREARLGMWLSCWFVARVRLLLAMTQHTEGYDGAIWRTIELTNDTAYKYYAIKCANNHGDGNNIGLRRVVFKKLV
jgi:hypothetical protein